MLNYKNVARAWAVIFALVGLNFAFMPWRTGEDVTWLANLLGLSGTIPSAERDLWWVLACSLMSCITVLSWWTAKEPQNPGPYVALMTAKLVSTGLFLILAVMHGPAWVLCAVGDGFVALTLWFTRRRLNL